ncbi:hypothetical protein MCAP1_000672 [Malassezia caprae]|uniref:Signal sequence receptor subunit alpha n=1 Tax=Malassezia caprae TaxID=1381934 RepID=A0AAF0E4T5_9BASI|nr:hypothetical protein MCAP1_000672 [Malassezia caprae]
MRLGLAVLSFVAVLVALVRAEAHEDAPELNVLTTFPDNPFNIVKNGQANRVVFSIKTPPSTDRALTIESLTGAFLDPAREDGHKKRVLRNMTTTRLKDAHLLTQGQTRQVPFDFFSEFKPQKLDVEFRAMVVDQSSSNKYNVPLYRGSVTVEEPPQSLFDLQLLSVYAMGVALVVLIGYILFDKYGVALKRSWSKPGQKRKETAQPAAQPLGKNGKSYDEDWIVRIDTHTQPKQHNLRPRKPRGRK